MNIYLDIDGVLLANDANAANYAEDFIKIVLSKFPDSTYWLTTHCNGDANVPIQHIGHLFSEDTVALLRKIKPTKWETTKTRAIDFTQEFLWFDDDLFVEEKAELVKYGVLDNWIEVNLQKDPNQLLKFVTSFPIAVQAAKTV